MDTEIFQVDEETVVFPYAESVGSDFLGDGGWIFAETFGDVFECHISVKGFFDVQSVIESQMFLIAWY